MKKFKAAASLAAMMAVGATCAFAANPFVDVPADSWAYKSVVELADAGVIQGVDGNYFQGDRSITRYEAAEMVAKAMAHMDRATVEQRALINRLADEYADELNNLGVRVANLENRIGNIKFSGDARVRYQQGGASNHDNYKNDKAWDYRIRLRGVAQVNDRTTATVGISTGDVNFGGDGAASGGEADIYADNIKIDYNFGSPNWNLSLGRTDTYILGGENSYGYQYGDVFDRAELTFNNGKIGVTAGYGKFREGDIAGDDAEELEGVKTGYGQIEGFFGNDSAVGVYYNDFSRAGGSYRNSENYFDVDDLWGAYASINIGSKWNLLANYESISRDRSGDSVSDPEVWIGRLTYGSVSEEDKGSWDIWVEYLNAEKGALIGGATNSWRDDSVLDGVESWGVGIDYAISKNVVLTVAQSFGTSGKNGNSDPDEFTDVELNFFF